MFTFIIIQVISSLNKPEIVLWCGSNKNHSAEYYVSDRRKNCTKRGAESMRRPKRKRCVTGAVLAAAAFFGAVMCISFFSVKVLLFAVAALLIIIGIFLLKC